MKAYYILRFADGTYAGSPLNTTTTNPHLAGCSGTLAEARAWAKALPGATPVSFQEESERWIREQYHQR